MVEYELRDLFIEDSVNKQMYINVLETEEVLDNTKLYNESFTLTESISTGGLVIGSCEAAEIKFTCKNDIGSLKGKTLEISMVLNENADKPFMLGKYKVVEDTPQADRLRRDIVAFDFLYDIINANVYEWYIEVFPYTEREVTDEDGNKETVRDYGSITLKQFRDSFFTYLGVDQREVSLANDNIFVTKTLSTENGIVSGKDIINAICEINGAFGHMGRDGVFDYVLLKETDAALYPSNEIYPNNGLYPSDGNAEIIEKYMPPVEYSDYEVQKITKLSLRQNGEVIGVDYGTEGNTYTIDNFLYYGKTNEEITAIARNIFEVVKNIDYVPVNFNKQGNPCLEVGDVISIALMDGSVIDTYILERNMSGIQALVDNIVASGEEYYSTDVNSIGATLSNLNGKVENTIVEIQRTAEGLSTKVSKGDVSSEISQEAGKISIQANRLSIKSNNFELTETGSITAKDGTIGGWNITDTNLQGSYETDVYSTSMSMSSIYGIEMRYNSKTTGDSQVTRLTDEEFYTRNSKSGTTQIEGGVTRTTTLYVNGSPITASDENVKNTISPLSEKYEDVFAKLKAKTFKYNDGTSDRLHMGFIAQEVESAIESAGVDSKDFAAYVKEESGKCGIRYEEITALNTHMIQKANKRIAELESEVEELKNLVNQLINKGE